MKNKYDHMLEVGLLRDIIDDHEERLNKQDREIHRLESIVTELVNVSQIDLKMRPDGLFYGQAHLYTTMHPQEEKEEG